MFLARAVRARNASFLLLPHPLLLLHQLPEAEAGANRLVLLPGWARKRRAGAPRQRRQPSPGRGPERQSFPAGVQRQFFPGRRGGSQKQRVNSHERGGACLKARVEQGEIQQLCLLAMYVLGALLRLLRETCNVGE